MNEATFKTVKIETFCGEPRCTRRPTTIAIGIMWADRQTAIYAFCDEHAAAAMSRARAEKAAEEGLQ